MNKLMNELMNNEGVCRTAPATPGLIIRQGRPPAKSTTLQITIYVL